MRTPLISIVVLLCIFFASCLKPGGKYVVIKVESSTGGNDTIKNSLKNRLLGKEFEIEFAKDYVSIEDSEHNKTYLAKENNSSGSSDFYLKEITVNHVKYSVSLYNRNNEKLIYIVRADGKVNDIFNPTQSGNLPPWGEVRCMLSKIEP